MAIGKIIRESIRLLHIDRLLRPFSKNSMVDSPVGKLVPENWQYKPGTMRHATRDGIQYTLDISDYQGWLLYYGFLNDRPDGLFDMVKPGFNIMDIGANIGQTCMQLSKLISPQQTIWAFEPDPVNYKRLSENLRLNAIPNIRPVNAGLGSHEHRAGMTTKTGNNRGGSNVQLNGAPGEVAVDIITLDKFVEENGCKIGLMKIDVEGYEMEVLKGAEACIRAQRPLMFIEIDDALLRSKNTSASEIVAWLGNLNYIIYKAGTKEKLGPAHDFSGCHFDICVVPNPPSPL